MLEAKPFTLYTDHRPLTHAFQQRPEKASPRQLRHLDFIGQFTTDIRYLPGSENMAADALSRINALSLNDVEFFKEFSAAQATDSELQAYLHDPSTTNLQLQRIPLFGTGLWLTCDVSTGVTRPFVPATLRCVVFHKMHDHTHLGPKATVTAIRRSYVWPSLHVDVKNWCRTCMSSLPRHQSSFHSSYRSSGRGSH